MPTPTKPVAYRGKMVPRQDGVISKNGLDIPRIKMGYQPENRQWRDELCDRDDNGHLVGKDPMTLSLDVLTASGHPYARTGEVIYRLRIMHGVDTGEARHDGFLGLQPQDFPKRLTRIREVVCHACCAGNKAEIRRCAIYDCPAWPFRMGHNPHNPRRGRNPFA